MKRTLLIVTAISFFVIHDQDVQPPHEQTDYAPDLSMPQQPSGPSAGTPSFAHPEPSGSEPANYHYKNETKGARQEKIKPLAGADFFDRDLENEEGFERY